MDIFILLDFFRLLDFGSAFRSMKMGAGFIVWRFEFRRDDKDPAPWEENAKKYSCIMKEDDDAEANSKSKRNVQRDDFP